MRQDYLDRAGEVKNGHIIGGGLGMGGGLLCFLGLSGIFGFNAVNGITLTFSIGGGTLLLIGFILICLSK